MYDMGLKELTEGILSDYNTRIAGLKGETKTERGQIMSSAELEAKKLLDKAKSEALETAKVMERRELAAARLEAKNTVAKAREAVVDRILDEARQGLADFAGSPEYKKLLPKILEKAASGIKGDYLVHARKKDKTLLKKYTLSREDLDCVGGVLVTSTSANVTVDATLESLFEKQRPELRETIYGRVSRKCITRT